MIAIFAATKVEAHFFLKFLKPVKKDGIYHYRGDLAGKNAALFLTRPGVASAEQVRRFLRLYTIDSVISTGACANLTPELTHLEAVKIAQATAPGKKIFQLSASGRRCVSVTRLVIDDAAKADLRTQTKADILDMETFTLAQIASEKEFAALPFSAIRIVDDLPGEQKYLYKEKMLRDLVATTPSGRLKTQDILRFGVWDYFRITLRRHRVARAIFDMVKREINK